MLSPPSEIARLVEEHGARGVLLDANLLVLYVAGRHDQRLVASLKATRSLGLGARDFQLVVAAVGAFGPLLTTPHVLTEVNGLLNTGLPGRHRWDVMSTFSAVIGESAETSASAPALARDPLFRRLGLTDASILSLAVAGPVVMSTDLNLCVALESRGLKVINYNRIRPL